MSIPILTGCTSLDEAADLVWEHLDPETRTREYYLGVGHYAGRSTRYMRDCEHPEIVLMRDATGIWMRVANIGITYLEEEDVGPR